MNFSYNWLRDLVDQLDTPPHELSQLITVKTAESEGVEQHGDDSVIEIDNKSLTHRPDLWGHYGMAREVAAILGRKLVDPVKPAQFPGSAPFGYLSKTTRCARATRRWYSRTSPSSRLPSGYIIGSKQSA